MANGSPCSRASDSACAFASAWSAGKQATKRLAGHQDLREARRHPRGVHKADVQPLVHQVDQLVARTQFAQHQPQLGVVRRKALQHLRQPAVEHRAGKTNLQTAQHALRHLARLARGQARLVQQGARCGHKRLPRRGELHAPAVAGEELRAHRGFELLDVERERRLGDGQALRGAAEVQLFGQHQEIAQVAEFHE